VENFNVQLQIEGEWLIIKNSEVELKTKSPAKIGRFLTQNIIRIKLAKNVTTHLLKGTCFPTLRKNDISNKFLRNTFIQCSDAFFRFAVAGRADCLATPANIQRWNRLEEENGCRCNQKYKPTLAHILNRCTPNFRSMTDRQTDRQTDRHDRVVRCVRKAFEKHIA
jgi:hypothetical protein